MSAYIVAAYWFTASTSFANPAVTVARSLTATFAGIRTIDVAPFVGAQLAGAAAACHGPALVERPPDGVSRCLHTIYNRAKLGRRSETRPTQALDIFRSRLLIGPWA